MSWWIVCVNPAEGTTRHYLGLIYSQIFMGTSLTIHSSMVYDVFYLIFCERSICNNFYFTWVILRKLNARPNTKWKPVVSVFLSRSRSSTISSNSFSSNQTNLSVNGSGLTYDSQEGIWKSLLSPQSVSIFFFGIWEELTLFRSWSWTVYHDLVYKQVT